MGGGKDLMQKFQTWPEISPFSPCMFSLCSHGCNLSNTTAMEPAGFSLGD